MKRQTTLPLEGNDAIAKALAIVGNEDGTGVGVNGSVIVQGEFASAIMRVQMPCEEARNRYGVLDQPVKVSRQGKLEVWCRGFCVEGRGVRKLVHQAAREVGYLQPTDCASAN